MTDRADRIEKRGSKYVVLSKEGAVLGEHDSREAANRQLAAVEASKNDGPVRYDVAELRMDTATITDEGWLRVEAAIGRADVVLPYLNADGSIRREFRPASEIFSAESMASFDGVPLTNRHPPIHLDANTATQFTVGSISTPRREGNLLIANVLVTDAASIKEIQDGTRQLSPGYRVRPDEAPGEFRGERFDLKQRDVRGNHVAFLPVGRQGSEVSLRMDSGDAVLAITTKEADDMADDDKTKTKKPVTTRVDGHDIETDEETATVLADVEESRKRVDAELAELKAANKERDEKLAALQAKADKPTDIEARLDAMEAAHKQQRDDDRKAHDAALKEQGDRMDAVATAKSLIPDYKPGEKTRSDVMIDVIDHALGDETAKKVREKNDTGYTDAHFEQALKVETDRQNHGLKLMNKAKGAGTESRKDEAGAAKVEHDNRVANAHKQTA